MMTDELKEVPSDLNPDTSSNKEPLSDSQKEIDLNGLFPEENSDLNALFPDQEMKELLKKVCKNKKDIKGMTKRFEEDLWEKTNENEGDDNDD